MDILMHQLQFLVIFSFFRFRNGLLNCLVATDIIDEGIDVPKCSLVIRYDFPLDVRTYIQSKGRARHAYSHYKILIQKDELQHLQRYNEFQIIEKYLKKVLLFCVYLLISYNYLCL